MYKNTNLKDCKKDSILTAAMTAATLDLPINPNFGYAFIIPYKGEAQFQMGYKGFIQLAIRSGQIKKLNASVLTKSQFKSYDDISGTLKYDSGTLKYDLADITAKEPFVYVAYMELVNGFEKYLARTPDELKQHATKYSQSLLETSRAIIAFQGGPPTLMKWL